jgi:2-furoyl-CoA dehydrogenase FAD binding subunit
MKPVAFDYVRPDTVEETLGLMAEMGSDAVLLAGGMSLGPMLNLRLVRPSTVIDIGRIGELGTIDVAAATLSTGAAVRQRVAQDSGEIVRDIPLLAAALPWVGHMQTRNRGTLGGSVAHADPSAEVPLCLATLNGRVVLRSRRRTRAVAAREFFLGMLTTARAPEEMVVGLEWPRRSPGEGVAFEELSQRHGDFAIAAVACRVRVDKGRAHDISLGVGGVEDRPVVVDLSDFEGGDINEDLIESVVNAVGEQLDPLNDHAASAEQRRSLARSLSRRTLRAAIADATEGAGA